MSMQVNNLGKTVQDAGSAYIPGGVCLSFTVYISHQLLLLLCIRKNDEGQTLQYPLHHLLLDQPWAEIHLLKRIFVILRLIRELNEDMRTIYMTCEIKTNKVEYCQYTECYQSLNGHTHTHTHAGTHIHIALLSL